MRMENLLLSILVVSLFFISSAFGGCLTGDCENGKGMMAYDDGTEYSGEFKEGQANGMGTFTYPEGKMIQTQKSWSDPTTGKEWQTGFPMGKLYTGEVKNGKRNGFGTLTYYSGAKYTGNFVDDMLQGKGTMENTNGVIVKGDFDKGRPNGTGHVTFSDGRIYEGEMVENQIQGKGIMIYPDGKKLDGIFEKGKLVITESEKDDALSQGSKKQL